MVRMCPLVADVSNKRCRGTGIVPSTSEMRGRWGRPEEAKNKMLVDHICKELCKEAGTSSNKEMSVAGWKGEPGAIKLAVLCSRKLESFMMNYK